MRALAIEWAPQVTVNAVVPGYTQKDVGAHAALDAAAWEAVKARIPLQRLGLPADVAADSMSYFRLAEMAMATSQFTAPADAAAHRARLLSHRGRARFRARWAGTHLDLVRRHRRRAAIARVSLALACSW